MAENVKPQSGAWNTMNTEEYAEGIKFEINIPVKVCFSPDFSEPREQTNKDGDGVFYIFPVTVNKEEKSLMTSAWSLLRALKENEPLAGKTLLVTKKLINGKQQYFVDIPADAKNPTQLSSQVM